MKKPSILVTGAAGLIGSNYCQWVLKNHPTMNVIALDDLSGGYLDWIPDGCVPYVRNVGSDLEDIFTKYDIKYVVHAAAIAAESIAAFNRKYYYENNVVNSANLINCAIKYGVERFVFFSSMAVYGNNPAPYIETQHPNPIDSYGIGKLAVELDLKCAYEQHGLKYSIIRAHSVYGPNQNLWDAYRNVLTIWMRKILSNEPVTIYGNGLQTRAFTYIDDIMPCVDMCVFSPTTQCGIFNIGNDHEMTLLEALSLLEDVVGYELPRTYYPAVHEVPNAYSDHTLAKTVLGLECKTTLNDGLNKLWEWAKSQPQRSVQKREKFELEVGLYEQFR